MKIILSSFIWFLIHTIEFFEYFFYKEVKDNIVFDSQSISGITVETDTGYHPISFIHQGKRDYIYTLKFDNGLKIRGADDHPLIREDYSETNIINVSAADLIRTKRGLARVMSRKKSWFKCGQMDLTVNSPDHRYYADDILVHNCVTFDTEVEIFDSQEDKYYRCPIFELHYKYKANRTWWDNLEWALYKALYKVKRKIQKLEQEF